MKWFKFEPQEEEKSETESSSMLVYLSPEAMKHAVIVDDFASLKNLVCSRRKPDIPIQTFINSYSRG